MKILDIRPRTNVKHKALDNFKNIGFQHKSRDEDKPNKDRGIQCHECEGLCHIKSECPTFFKKDKKVMLATWFDEDFEDESEE